MPITVSCPACSSRFSLSDDLYRRRVVGSLVKVKCRNCNAEIAVDATEHTTMPSPEAPRKHPNPPRRQAATQLGLGTPPATAELATSTPVPFDLAATPLPLNATVTPLPTDEAADTSLSPVNEDSNWSEEPTLAINLSNVKPPPRPPVARLARMGAEEDPPELIEAEEIPVSSSGVPTLDALTEEAGGAHVPHGKPAPDEFLVSLGASNDGILGTDGVGTLVAPTIDVTSFAAEIKPSSVDVTPENEEDELEYRRPARANTVPLFDLRGVLPAASREASLDSAAAEIERSNKAADLPSRPRERKYVIAPEAAETENEAAKSGRSSAGLWMLAVAAAVAAVVGFRGLRWTQPIATESPALPAEPVVHNQAALPAAEPPPVETREAASVTPTASAVAQAAPTAQNAAVVTTRSAAPNTAVALKTNVSRDSDEAQPSSASEPAAEKSDVNAVEAHNAPPPAAPDTEFDRDAARNALAGAAVQASSCRKEGDPTGTANLTITFAPSGRVTSAQVQGPPFSGTATGGCIASTMRRASVPAFSGDFVTVSKTIVVQ